MKTENPFSFWLEKRLIEPDFDGSAALFEMYSIKRPIEANMNKVRITPDGHTCKELIEFLKTGHIPS
jgi:hypothetical protein